MIKLLEPGFHEFSNYCKICGCHYSYTREDIEESITNKFIILCPDCGNYNEHADFSKQAKIIRDCEKLGVNDLPPIFNIDKPRKGLQTLK